MNKNIAEQEIEAIYNKNTLVIIATVLIAFITHSAWSILGFFFLSSWKPDVCPKCGHLFQNEVEDEEDESETDVEVKKD